MSKLSSPLQLIAHAGLNDSVGMRVRCDDALERATLRLQMLLSTTFDQGDVADYYAVNPRVATMADGGITFVTSKALLTSADDVELMYAKSLRDLLHNENVSVLEAQIVDADRGWVFVERSLLQHCGPAYFQLEYSYGLTVHTTQGTDDPLDGVYENVPPWLVELAETIAVNVLTQATPCDKGQDYPSQGIDHLMKSMSRVCLGGVRPIVRRI